MAQQVERRRILRGLGLIGMAAALPAPVAAGVWDMPASWLEPRVAELFGDLDSARQIGRAYLEQAPAEARRDRLVASLQAVLPPTASREQLQRRLRQDFAEGRIVNVHGWVLSHTEARLCGLAALA